MRVLLDLNVLLDLLLDRKPWSDDARPVLDAILAGNISGHVSAHSITTLYYIARKLVGPDQAINAVIRCLAAFEIVSVDGPLLEAAAALRGSDFEDDVQIASAMNVSADAIMTRDPKGFAASPVRAVTAATLSAELRKP